MSEHTLVVARHAQAKHGDGSDAQRELTDKGRRQARHLGAELHHQIAAVNTVFLTEAARTAQTWQEMVVGAEVDVSHVDVKILQDTFAAQPGEVLERVRMESDGHTTIIVGHEPWVSLLSYSVLKEPPASPDLMLQGMPTASAVVAGCDKNWKEWHKGCATLKELVGF